MPPRKNPLKLNALQLRTLVLLQELAKLPEIGQPDEATGNLAISQLPRPHGNHAHIGPYVVASRELTGFSNPSVWAALARRKLIVGEFPIAIALTPEGTTYDTGLSEQFTQRSDH